MGKRGAVKLWSIDYWQEGALGSVIWGGEAVVFEKERDLWGVSTIFQKPLCNIKGAVKAVFLLLTLYKTQKWRKVLMCKQ